MGYDNRQSLGDKETGAKAALPIWMDVMKAAIADKPDEVFPADTQPGSSSPREKQIAAAVKAGGETLRRGWVAAGAASQP